MSVEAKPVSFLINSRPENVSKSNIESEVFSTFYKKGLSVDSDQDLPDIAAAVDVVNNIVETELANKLEIPHPLYLLRGQVASIVVGAIADFKKAQVDRKDK